MATTYVQKQPKIEERLTYEFTVPKTGFGDEATKIAELARSYREQSGGQIYLTMQTTGIRHRVIPASVEENYEGLAGKNVTFTVLAVKPGKKNLAQKTLFELQKILGKTA